MVFRHKYLIYFFLFLELGVLHLHPGSLLYNLTAKAILNSAVEKSEVNAPLCFVCLSRVLLVPNTVECLISEMNGSINVTHNIGCEVVSLHKFVVHRVKRLLSNLIIQLAVHEIVVSIELAVNIRANLLEFRLGIGVRYFVRVRAFVEVLVPINGQIVWAWDALPVWLVFRRQL